MKWYTWKFWRIAYIKHGSTSNAIGDSQGYWIPLTSKIFWLTRRMVDESSH